MANKKWLYWVLQIFGWGAVLSIGLLAQYLENNEVPPIKTIQQVVIFLITVIFLTHLYRTVILKLNWLDKKLNKSIPLVLIGSLVLSCVLLLMNMLVDWTFGEDPYTKADILNGIFSLFIFSLIWSVIYFAFHFFDKSRKQEVKNLQLESSQKESELINLKNQLNPHFMFNAMNSIRALVDEDPKLAKQSITQLSNLLRNTLHLGKQRLITLKDELQVVHDYLSLEKIRFEERLIFSEDIAEGLNGAHIPPLIIQTLIENAIKHGIGQLANGGVVNLTIDRKEDKILIQVKNTGKYNPSSPSKSGIGLDNAKKRLAILYGELAGLNIRQIEGEVLAEIIIPIELKK